ncbi:MAG: cobalt ECF transporter T component CbiQ [Methanophagales archaeon ANME-1-THS]|nr:MAG: cobalt ECF transporter T component CbiQ [Methanophagales archaeon ANME-1-THS]
MHLDHTFESYTVSNKLVKIRAGKKIFLSIFTLFIAVYTLSHFILLLILFTMSSLTIWSGVRIKDYLKLLMIPLTFLLPSISVLAFLHGSEPMLTFSILEMHLSMMREGLELCTLLMMRSMAGISCLFFLIMTTPISEILDTMRKFRIPEIVIELSFLVYKLIFVLIDELESTKIAQDARLGYLRGNRIRSLSLLISSMLVRSFEKAENMERALEARCYAGKMPSLKFGRENESENKVHVFSLSLILMILFDACLLVLAVEGGD